MHLISIVGTMCSLALAQIQPEAPPFCEGFVPNPQERATFAEMELRNNGVSWKAMNLFAESWCEKPNDPARQAQVAKWRQAMVEKLGITPAMTIDSLRIRLDNQKAEAAIAASCKALSKDTAENGMAAAEAAVLGELIGCESKLDGEKIDAVADQSEQHSALWFVGYADLCYGDRDRDRMDPAHASNYAYCRVRAASVKPEAFEKELGADARFNETAKVVARETLAQVVRSQRLAEEAWGDELNAALKPVLVDAPAQAYAKWVAARQANEEAWAAVISIEQEVLSSPTGAPKPSCRQTLSAIAPKVFKGAKVDPKEWRDFWTADPLRVRFADAVAACEKPKHEEWQRPLDFVRPISLRPVGPLSAASGAMKAKLRSSIAEHPKFDWQKYGLYLQDESFDERDDQRRISLDSTDEAPNASITPKGADAVIAFKQTKWKELTLSCVETRQIDRIDAMGNLIYRRNCKNGPDISHTSHVAPILVPKEYSAALKPGQLLVFSRPKDGVKLPACMPLVSYANEKKQKLVSVLGQAVN